MRIVMRRLKEPLLMTGDNNGFITRGEAFAKHSRKENQ